MCVGMGSMGRGLAAETTAPLKIVTIKAMPYYPSTGVIRRSTNLFDPRLALRNVIISGGDPRAKIEEWDIVYGTTATYIETVIESASISPATIEPSLRIEMRVRSVDSDRLVKTESVKVISIMSTESRIWYIPFFIYGTGCEKLEITVHLVSDKIIFDETSRTIPFSCGE